MVALAVWCAAGELTVVDRGSAAVRLAVPAPLWVLSSAFVASAFVSVWRRRPLLATPALLATVPWWPIPAHPIALIWTGPLAWVPVAAAVIVAAIAMLGRRRDEHVTSLPRPRRHAIAAGLLSLVAGAAVAWSVDPRIPGGDEPHYLVITQSLLSDGDLRIQNNHDRRDYAAYFDGMLAPDTLVRGQDGQQYSIHAPGVSVLVLPAFAVFGYPGAQATMLIAAAAAGALVWWIGWLASGRVSAAWFGWAAVAGSVTFLIQSVSIYPDGAGAVAVAAACWLLLRLSMRGTRQRPMDLAGVSALLAMLPWLHTRFALLAAGFGVAIVAALLGDERSMAQRARRVAMFAALPIFSAVAWFTFFYRIYGTADPRAPYGPMSDASGAFVPGGLMGLFFDQQFGLLMYTPVLLSVLGLAAAGKLGLLRGAVVWPLVIAAAYLAGVATVWMWWAGRPATPARFANAVLPALAAPLALVYARSTPSMRTAWTALLAVSLGTSAGVLGIDRGVLAWNDRTAQSQWLDWLSPVVNLPRGLPSFFWRLDPAVLASEIPFFAHAAFWFAAAVLAGWLAIRFGTGWTAPARALLTWWLGASAWMALVLGGWTLNGASGLDPARSQLAALTRLANHRAAYRIGPLAVERWREDVDGRFRIASEEPGRLEASPPWLVLNGVPPGTYDMTVSTTRPAAGTLLVYVGPHQFRTIAFDPIAAPRMRLALPAGARTLVVRADAGLQDVPGTATIAPVALRSSRSGLARTAMRSDGSDVFFLDDEVFVEDAGFWTRGARTASFVFATDPGRPAIALNLRNGPQRNAVTVQAGALTIPETLQPGESKTLAIPVDPDGVVTISLTTSGGFRPSEVGGSRDRRYLGVWVEIK